MNPMKSGQLIALATGMIILAVLGFNITRAHAHGHGGHAGSGHGHVEHIGHHHGEHPHVHYRGGEQRHEGAGYDSNYHHSHGDYGDHYHDCRPIKGSGTPAGTDRRDPYNEECQNHNGEWEPNWGD